MNFMNQIKHPRHAVLLAFLCLGMAAATGAADGAPATPATPATPAALATPQADPVFALVNGKPITVRQYNALFRATLRQRYYHGKVPEGQEQVVAKEISDLLVERELLAEEAAGRGIQPDEKEIEQAIAKALATADARRGAQPGWQEQREQLLPGLKEQAARQSLLEQFEKTVRDVPQPLPAEVRAYYKQKPDLFTEPERLSLSVILLKVDPGAPKGVWDKAREEAQAIYLRLKNGADFAELARLHSGDRTADGGGDMGYVHGGMLPQALQGKIDKFEVGVVGEPITTLEGVALFRVDVRVPPKLREFAEVEQRAQGLFYRDRQDQAWQETKDHLRAVARIEILDPAGGDSAKTKEAAKNQDSVKPKGDAKKKGGTKKKDSAKTKETAKKKEEIKKP